MKDIKKYLLDKEFAVEDIGSTISKYVTDIFSITYEIWEHDEVPEHYVEILKITFIGGSYLVRNCTGTSIQTIVGEIGKYLDGGYYEEIDYYEKVIQETCHLAIL